jgi:hypothetical protein
LQLQIFFKKGKQVIKFSFESLIALPKPRKQATHFPSLHSVKKYHSQLTHRQCEEKKLGFFINLLI